MNRQFLLLATGILLISSCGNNSKPSNVQVLIDSTVNVNVAKHDAENAIKNDSIINAEAKKKADAMQGSNGTQDKKADQTTPATTNTTTSTTEHRTTTEKH